jgi:hypothetical protein
MGRFPVALQYVVPHSKGFSLGPVAFVCGAAVGDVFPFWAMSGLYFLQNGPYVMVVKLFCSQGSYISASCGYGHISLYLLDVCQHLDFVAGGTLLLA